MCRDDLKVRYLVSTVPKGDDTEYTIDTRIYQVVFLIALISILKVNRIMICILAKHVD